MVNATLREDLPWHGVLSYADVWSWSSVTSAIIACGSFSGYLAYPVMKSKYFLFMQNLIISIGMSGMLVVVFFELIEPSYHNYNKGPPGEPLCSFEEGTEFDETPFMIIAIMAYGAFALFFNVDKVMTLILSYNESDEEDDSKNLTDLGNVDRADLDHISPNGKGHDNPAFKTTETDFTGDEKPTPMPIPSPNRSRADTGASQVVRRNRTNTGALMGSPSAAVTAQRSRSNTDLTSVKQIQQKEHLKANNPDQVEETGIHATAWVSIAGAVVENTIYGIAVGAGYHRNIGCGVAIGIALLFESIPHKITDFMLLVGVGMTKKQAVLANFLSSACIFIGLSISVPLFEGAYDNNWVFGLSLGMFVYAGMGVLLPELDAAIGNSVELGYNKWVCLVIQNLGILAAFFVIFPVSYYGPCWTGI